MKPPAAHPHTWPFLAYITFGPLVWAACHSLLYAIHWLCCVSLENGVIGAEVILAAMLMVVALCIAALIFSIGRPAALERILLAGAGQSVRTFSRDLMRLLSALSLFGVGAAGAAVIALPACT